MSIKWYRSAKHVLPPTRRDNPKPTKSTRIKKTKKLYRPKGPGVKKPHVRLPFVQAANHKTFLPNLSAAGISAVMDIAEKNGLKTGEVRWVLAHEGSDCPAAASDGILATKKLCSFLSRMSWPTLEAFAEYGGKSGDGIWGISHINCRCYITIKLFDPANAGRSAVFEVYTDPALGAGRGSATVAAGYAWAYGTLTEADISGLDQKIVTDLTKMNSSDKDERREYRNRYDKFDHMQKPKSPEWYESEKGYVAPESPAAPAETLVEEPAESRSEERSAQAPVPAETEEERLERERLKKEKEPKGFLG